MRSRFQHIIFAAIVMFMMAGLLPSCTKAPKLKVTKSMALAIDTIVKNQKDSIYEMMTAECEKNYDPMFEQIADSLLQSYLKEIESLTR